MPNLEEKKKALKDIYSRLVPNNPSVDVDLAYCAERVAAANYTGSAVECFLLSS
jgi:hypothetical protein